MSHVLRAYSYLRCSTPEQMRGDSFRRQSEAASRYAKEHGLVIDDSLRFDDQGVSAFKGANREAGLGRFLDAVEAGKVDRGSYLLVESLDRLSREKARRALRVLEDLVDAGIVVVTLSDRAVYSTQTLDENPIALFQALLVMMRAHEESSLKSARIARAWEAKRQRARTEREAMTKRCPAWLRVDGGKYAEIFERAELVREIFRRAIEGDGKRAIIAEIRKKGILPWGHGRVWHESYVEKILRSEATFGRYAPLKGKDAPIEGYFPVTVSEETYWTAQAARADRRTSRNPVPPGKGMNIFSGLARCQCGVGMHYVDKGQRSSGPYLVCGDFRTGGACTNGAKWLYREIVRDLIYHACMEADEKFAPDQIVQTMPNVEQAAARERYETATRKLVALTEAIAAGAGASLAIAHAAADLEVTKAKEILTTAETTARRLAPIEPFPEDLFCVLWGDPPAIDDPEWRRATAATLRRRLLRIEFCIDRRYMLVYPNDLQVSGWFKKEQCRLPGEIVVTTNAGWWNGKRDEKGMPTKKGRIEAEGSA